MANYKDKETVKETHTDAEWMLLLQKPVRNCDFCEYRSWGAAQIFYAFRHLSGGLIVCRLLRLRPGPDSL